VILTRKKKKIFWKQAVELELHTALFDEMSALPESRSDTTFCRSPLCAAFKYACVLPDYNKQ